MCVCMHACLCLPVYQVRLDWLPLPCIALIWPSQLSSLGSSQWIEHLPRKQYVVGSNPTRAVLFFIFHGKRGVQFSRIALL